jgi:hypothetical protein
VIWLPVTLVGFFFLARYGLGWNALVRARDLKNKAVIVKIGIIGAGQPAWQPPDLSVQDTKSPYEAENCGWIGGWLPRRVGIGHWKILSSLIHHRQDLLKLTES